MSAQAMGAVFAVQGISPSEKLVLLALANHADPTHRCFPSHATLASYTGLSDRTILTVLRALEGKSLLTREERRRPDGSRTSDVITLAIKGGEFISPPTEIDSEAKPQLTALGGETVSPHEPRPNPQEEPYSEASASARLFDFPDQPPDPNADAWKQAVVLLTTQGRMTDGRARTFFGKLIGEHRLEAREFLGPIGEARGNGTADPQSYLVAAAKSRERRKGDPAPEKRQTWI